MFLHDYSAPLAFHLQMRSFMACFFPLPFPIIPYHHHHVAVGVQSVLFSFLQEMTMESPGFSFGTLRGRLDG